MPTRATQTIPNLSSQPAPNRASRGLTRAILRVCQVLLIPVAMMATLPAPVPAETEVRNQFGKVVEIRTQQGNTTRVYDAKRNLIYTATRVGNQILFKDPTGIIIGRGGPGTISDPRGVLARIRLSGPEGE